MELVGAAASAFEDVFACPPTAYGCAPGRVEVLGNHTDYNEGFILSAAIDRHVVVCGRPVDGDTARVYARTFQEGESFSVRAPERTQDHFWLNFVQGVVDVLAKQGLRVGAFEALVLGDVPLGAGLSSSAAIEVATALFLQQLFPYDMSRTDLALTCQKAENEFVGVNCGILDQFTSVMGAQDHLVFLDCRDLDKFETIPLGSDVELVLAHTNASHDLSEGVYNELRAECFEAAKYFAGRIGGQVTHLRDVSLADFGQHKDGLPAQTQRRARHVISENARVLEGVKALRNGDRDTMGRCMLASHASSRDDFQNSCEELDTMVACAEGLPGYYGSRLSGGGFGGCTVNLVEAGQADAFAEALATRYEERTGLHPEMHACKAVDGAQGGSF